MMTSELTPSTFEDLEWLDDAEVEVDSGLKLWQESAKVSSHPIGTPSNAASTFQHAVDDVVVDFSARTIADVSGDVQTEKVHVDMDLGMPSTSSDEVLVNSLMIGGASAEGQTEKMDVDMEPEMLSTFSHDVPSVNTTDETPPTKDLEDSDSTLHYSWEAKLIETMVDCEEHQRPCIAHCRYGEEARHSWSECIERCVEDGMTKRLLLAGLPEDDHDAVHLEAEVPAGMDDLKSKKKREARSGEL